MDDPYKLHRFVLAQDEARTYDVAAAELRAGRKASHWMWFVFPQFCGLGQSPMSRTYAIHSLSEAQAYLAHPILGARLVECTHITNLTGRSARDIFGTLDALKLRSSMTLFARAAQDPEPFQLVLDRLFDGVPDDATEARLDSRDRER